jgi:hypothetical protein
MTDQFRTIVWFSCGAASAVCAKLLAKEENVEVVYIQPGSKGKTGGEHADNYRFLKDVESWIGKEIKVIGNDKYEDHWDVYLSTGFIKGPRGAICTRVLKREQRMVHERPGDIQVFGYTFDEKDRADSFRLNNPEVKLRTPLIEEGMSKNDCLGLLWQAGIKLPVMYEQGYQHNNCIGCVKGGMGYWNRIRRDYPDVFQTASMVEKTVGHAILKDTQTGEPIWLEDLDPNRGRMEDEPPISCGLTCQGLSLRID